MTSLNLGNDALYKHHSLFFSIKLNGFLEEFFTIQLADHNDLKTKNSLQLPLNLNLIQFIPV
ncbi:MAG: hypothetical protein CMP13_15330 [Zunongwangia sp.]|uniref:Uncharacterized protein n=1 Tax=Zunongwangia profunda TaxID=398743 RepID=A0A3D5J3I0_9FLAO|nr:hypothetical protein [Flavobacteriaceae bacterium]MAS71967.1 hypothetical protein [Zunongwangia sp.]HAJ81187.1 hypothetical protein [Zunongwangia profunda]HCV82635.1 hypothetical protein [Zunongwangia profunda]